MARLRTLGFDSIDGYSSFMIPSPPPGFEAFRAEDARRTMENVLYLPVHTGLSKRELIRLAEAVTAFENSRREMTAEQSTGPRRSDVCDDEVDPVATKP